MNEMVNKTISSECNLPLVSSRLCQYQGLFKHFLCLSLFFIFTCSVQGSFKTKGHSLQRLFIVLKRSCANTDIETYGLTRDPDLLIGCSTQNKACEENLLKDQIHNAIEVKYVSKHMLYSVSMLRNFQRRKCCKEITDNSQTIVRPHREVLIFVVLTSVGQPS